MTDYTIIGYNEIDKKETNNILDAVDMIKVFKKYDKKVIVVQGSVADGDEFIERVRRMYR